MSLAGRAWTMLWRGSMGRRLILGRPSSGVQTASSCIRLGRLCFEAVSIETPMDALCRVTTRTPTGIESARSTIADNRKRSHMHSLILRQSQVQFNSQAPGAQKRQSPATQSLKKVVEIPLIKEVKRKQLKSPSPKTTTCR